MSFGLSSEQTKPRAKVTSFVRSEFTPISETADLNISFAKEQLVYVLVDKAAGRFGDPRIRED